GYAARMATLAPQDWPHALLLLGDQVYADEPPPQTRRWLDSCRDTTVAPGYEVADFTEYVQLYLEGWSDPQLRWLMSTVPTAMIFDDHDVRDDWNISAAWRDRITSQPWWPERIRGALASYWVYQHIGNLSPQQRHADPTWRAVRTRTGTPGRCCGQWPTPLTPAAGRSGGAFAGISTACDWLSWTPAAAAF
ncbi:MAG: alkaline phosphatase D family protein, partial [Pseudonocardiaceae bacterium]